MSRLNRAVRKFVYRGIFPTIFPRPKIVDPSSMRRLLIIRCDAIGDMICTTPLIHSLHKHFPSTEIWIAASDRNAEIVNCDPAVKRVVTLVERGRVRRAGLSELRANRFPAESDRRF